MQSHRLTTFFFVLFLLALGPALASVWLGLQYLSNHREIDALRNAKLNREALELQLLKGHNSLHAVTPHADPRVAFVLNMHLQTTDLWAADGDKYPINSLGLRGQPIAPKPPGTKRIVLVSDSWLFGWRLPEDDKVEWALKRLLARYYPGLPLEVLTVAMPGWNVENAAAFLDDHADIINPDILIWAINSNDLWDTAGVLPPGVLSFKVSRSSQWVCPETSFQDQRWQVPFVLDGWKKNVALMNAAQRTSACR